MDSTATETDATTDEAASPTSMPYRKMSASAENDMEVDFVLIRDIPKMKYHDEPLRFVSQPGISQERYERRVLSTISCNVKGHRIDPAHDENERITITCPDRPDGTACIFTVHKSILMRSPTLEKFFGSEHYLPGCEMHLMFMLDPAACVKIAMFYLGKGADTFNQNCIDTAVDEFPNRIDRFQVLIRLYLLASNLGLPVLANMAYQGLLEREKPMPAGYTITLASLIFTPNVGFDERMREWCMRHLGYYVQHLKHIREWIELLPSLDEDFRCHWEVLTKLTNPRFSWPVDESKLPQEPDSDDELIKHLVRETKMPGFNMHHPFKDVASHRQQNSDADWEQRKSEIIGGYIDRLAEDKAENLTPHRSRSRKAIAWLHLTPQKNKGSIPIEQDMTWADQYAGNTSPEVAKAVIVLGMNDLGGKIIGASRPRRVSRLLFKLTHL